MALSEQEILRREALTELRKLESTLIRQTIYNYRLFERHPCRFRKYEGKEVILAGRLMENASWGSFICRIERY
jgi:lysyl-tRNA synthetase class 2